MREANLKFSPLVNSKNKRNVSSFALKVLKKIQTKGRVLPQANGGVQLGSLSVPINLLSELRSKGLLDHSHSDGWGISNAGISFVKRGATSQVKSSINKHIGLVDIDPYKRQHQLSAVVTRRINGSLAKLNVNANETPLGWLQGRKGRDKKPLLSYEQFEAAERFRRDFEMASIGKKITASYDGVPISRVKRGSCGGLNYTESQLAAKRRYESAIAAVGSGLSDALVRVCCYLEGFEAAEKSLGWPGRSMKLVILMALDRLKDHYQKGERPTK